MVVLGRFFVISLSSSFAYRIGMVQRFLSYRVCSSGRSCSFSSGFFSVK